MTKSGVNYAKAKHSFTIDLFEYEGNTAFALQLAPEAAAAKLPYMGKPRGRKAKSIQAAE